MFSFVADGLTVAITVLFPIFASYKALHTSDPALLAPWLIYFVVLSIVTTVEGVFDFILRWIPFYAWIRFGLHLYLILPGSQGATSLYQEHVEPFLRHHEREIDDFISQSHDSAKAAGLAYLEMGIEWVKVNVLGFAPKQPAQPRPAGQTFAQNLFNRFQMPSARDSNDVYGLLNQVVSGATALYAGNKDAQAAELTRYAHLIPSSIRNEDRLSYVDSQRNRLEVLLDAYKREQEKIRTQQTGGSKYHESSPNLSRPSSSGPSSGGLSRNRSEAEFDTIERHEISPPLESERPPYPVTPPPLGRRTSSGWMPWNWQRAQQPTNEDPLAYGKPPGKPPVKPAGSSAGNPAGNSVRAKVSGFELGDR